MEESPFAPSKVAVGIGYFRGAKGDAGYFRGAKGDAGYFRGAKGDTGLLSRSERRRWATFAERKATLHSERRHYALGNSTSFFSAAILRISSVIFIEQYLGPHMLQKWALLKVSWGSVSS